MTYRYIGSDSERKKAKEIARIKKNRWQRNNYRKKTWLDENGAIITI